MGMRKEEIRKGDYKMHRDIEERIKEEASYFLANNSTTRKTAKAFGVSKSLIHKDLSKRLAIVNPQLHTEVIKLLEHNKEVRHIRGGITTQKRYKKRWHKPPKSIKT